MPTSARQDAPILRKSSANSQLPNGPTESSAPTERLQSLPVSRRGGRLCPPGRMHRFCRNLWRIHTHQRLSLGTRGAGPKGLRGFERCKFGSTLISATYPLRHFLRKCHLPLPRGARQEAALERGSRRQRAAVICLKFNVYRRSISSWHTRHTASMSCARCT